MKRPGLHRSDLILLLAGLALVIAWDALGADMAVTGWFGDASGFPWREAFLTSRVLHDGGRWLAGLALASLAVYSIWPAQREPSRRRRLAWLAVVLVSIVAVPLAKRLSRTSCPWDLAEFGGTASYVPHWLPGVFDGGPGHCFPSGHAVSAFGFVGLYFLWRHSSTWRARAAVVTVTLLGALFATTQLVRGAHHISHSLWSGWLCWAIAFAAAALEGRRPTAAAAAGPSRS